MPIFQKRVRTVNCDLVGVERQVNPLQLHLLLDVRDVREVIPMTTEGSDRVADQ